MGNKVNWGILGHAKIAREKMIPAFQKSPYCKLVALASGNLTQAKKTARLLKIDRVYGSYEELLNDPEVEAIYIPLPNHLHVTWAIKCIEAGKHVLCEKPMGLTAAEVLKLQQVAAAHPQVMVMEGFMYRFHPQWQEVKKMINLNKIGQLKTIESFFSYFNPDPENIRNQAELGGGALMDIGCYCISLARFLFAEEPRSVTGTIERDAIFKTDILTSGILNFANGTSTFTCSTQLMPFQRVNVLGTTGRIELEVPFNPMPDQQTKLVWHHKDGREEIFFEPVNQYTLQASAFSKAIKRGNAVPYDLEDSVNNMKVMDAIFQAAGRSNWVNMHS